MTNLSNIPNEIIELILQDETLSFTDVINFGKTSSQYWHLVNKSNITWKSKFKQTWPDLIARGGYKKGEVVDWKTEFQMRMLIGRETMKEVKEMSAKYIDLEELSDPHWDPLKNILISYDYKRVIYFMIDELMACIHHEDRSTNLTNKYYSEKGLRHLRQMDMCNKLREFKGLPLEEQLLERGAVIVAQWSQPTLDITDENISSQLDAIADKVLAEIETEFGDKHEAVCVPRELRDSWRRLNISDNHYNPYVSRQVIETISKVLFKDLGFYGNNELYYCPENSYINKVLENTRGIPITLSILYESVARRVGIKCEPVSFPGHFLLRWRDCYREGSSAQSFYLDVFNGGIFLNRNSCPQFATAGRCPMSGSVYEAATPMQVLERMANNLEVAGRQRTMLNGRPTRLRSALELQHEISPANLNCLVALCRFYIENNLIVSDLQEFLGRMLEEDPDAARVRSIGQATTVARTMRGYMSTYQDSRNRSKDCFPLRLRDSESGGDKVEFAVGMVMRHKRFGYSCVIFGWDPTCVASEHWKQETNVDRLKRKDRQPFYNVLVNDGSKRYAAEENLILEVFPERQCIDHSQVGRYFDAYCGSYFQMNQEMLKNYPQDPPIIEKLLGN